jgi:hypothetical protein
MQPLAVSRGVRKSEPELPQLGALNSVASAVKRPYVSIPPREVRCRSDLASHILFKSEVVESLYTADRSELLPRLALVPDTLLR